MTDTSDPSDPSSTPRSTTLQGMLLGLLAFAVYATHDAAIKQLGASYSPFQIVFFVVLFSFPVVTLMLVTDPTEANLCAYGSCRGGRAMRLLRLLSSAHGRSLRNLFCRPVAHYRSVRSHFGRGRARASLGCSLCRVGWRAGRLAPRHDRVRTRAYRGIGFSVQHCIDRCGDAQDRRARKARVSRSCCSFYRSSTSPCRLPISDWCWAWRCLPLSR